MIEFINPLNHEPYLRLKAEYDAALENGQEYIEAISIASYSNDQEYVDSRYVNLKLIDGDKFIFFTNYNSKKSIQFMSHKQIAVNIFWQKTNTQIRIKANVRKLSKKYNNSYFRTRSPSKNALAISSQQSQAISSYSKVIEKYEEVMKNNDLKECPSYWGGYEFIPYEIEFWKGHQFRLNKRDLFVKVDKLWSHNILEP
tara:strand:- start:1361 stop:1957 length:597 start_codon:yes stop_codon:yes gene_type:complete